jgi:predicted DNA-binding transcriptional regulator AlpA
MGRWGPHQYNMESQVIDPDKYYSNREVQAMFNMSRSTHYEYINQRRFPRQTKLGPRKVGTLGRALIEHREKLIATAQADKEAA